jgi:Excreted virulence factor EspC, type VII ESX diderm
MDANLQVDVNELRRCGSGVTRTADRIAAGLAEAPPLAVPAPGWSVATALAALAEATAQHVAVLGDRTATHGRAVLAAADEYDGADERAARRLRLRW